VEFFEEDDAKKAVEEYNGECCPLNLLANVHLEAEIDGVKIEVKRHA
jgi:hypothetical protein